MVVARGDTNRTIELGPSRRPVVIGLPLCQSRPTFGRLAPTGLLPSGPNQLPVRLEHAPDLTQLAWIRHAVDARDEAIPHRKRKDGNDGAPAERNDAGLAIYLPGHHGGSRGCAEESHELLGDLLAADVWLVDHGQRPTHVSPSDDRRIQ